MKRSRALIIATLVAFLPIALVTTAQGLPLLRSRLDRSARGEAGIDPVPSAESEVTR